jgi:hypothetical protein
MFPNVNLCGAVAHILCEHGNTGVMLKAATACCHCHFVVDTITAEKSIHNKEVMTSYLGRIGMLLNYLIATSGRRRIVKVFNEGLKVRSLLDSR